MLTLNPTAKTVSYSSIWIWQWFNQWPQHGAPSGTPSDAKEQSDFCNQIKPALVVNLVTVSMYEISPPSMEQSALFLARLGMMWPQVRDLLACMDSYSYHFQVIAIQYAVLPGWFPQKSRNCDWTVTEELWLSSVSRVAGHIIIIENRYLHHQLANYSTEYWVERKDVW